jgi:uncharacterized protein YkwD
MPKCLLGTLAALALTLPAAATAGLSREEGSVLREMNRVRAEYGLGMLRYDPRLERAARAHSRHMLRTNTFEHGAFGRRMLQFNVRGSIAGENLAWGVGPEGTARAFVAAWLASPEHRANLLRRTFKLVGVGDLAGPFQGQPGAHVATVDFAN